MTNNVHQVQVHAQDDTPATQSHKERQPPLAAEMAVDATDIRQVKKLVTQLSAACKVRHDELLQKMEALEQKITHMDQELSALRSGLSLEGVRHDF